MQVTKAMLDSSRQRLLGRFGITRFIPFYLAGYKRAMDDAKIFANHICTNPITSDIAAKLREKVDDVLNENKNYD